MWDTFENKLQKFLFSKVNKKLNFINLELKKNIFSKYEYLKSKHY